MKTIEEILNEYSERKVFDNWTGHQMTILKEIAERYAQQRVNEVLDNILEHIEKEKPLLLRESYFLGKIHGLENIEKSILKLKNDGK